MPSTNEHYTTHNQALLTSTTSLTHVATVQTCSPNQINKIPGTPHLTTSSSHLVVESIQTGRPTTPDSDSPADRWEVDTPPLAEHHHLTPTPQLQLGTEDDVMRYANESPVAEKGDQTHRTVYNMFEAMHDLTDRFNGIRLAGLWENFLDEYTLWYSKLPRLATLDTFPTPSHDSELEEQLKTVESNISHLTEANAYLADRLLTTETPTMAAQPPSPITVTHAT
ncbi:uncharacterized protein EI90DRAFT_3132214 [Cantharellus anzutake]|uniref:uncharacterized protein n=1 Tax=Cantharellus anzutake TaxID=1750568 RepID=UPI001906A26E|nr:uncharacterized protein EI90DRAFT_3132214 [Cantharellus anzutake]KAF8319905.1 hypothetical protein EI90DRAFT_3132214 [Cantharellus anzutake]